MQATQTLLRECSLLRGYLCVMLRRPVRKTGSATRVETELECRLSKQFQKVVETELEC